MLVETQPSRVHVESQRPWVNTAKKLRVRVWYASGDCCKCMKLFLSGRRGVVLQSTVGVGNDVSEV